MDTAKIELAVQRYRECVAALDAARADLEAEAAVTLRDSEQTPEDWTRVASLTGWSHEELARLVDAAGEVGL
ncbi:hypothetical protein ABT160_31100 [Streptomyces sp. NPDC001941]|uniref:hypothetical protein n=1 Tax=Streptomyces sp. NPDC001941 TaxID=3154659 RepID=UPI00332EF28B